MNEPLHQIAAKIRADWKNVNFAARPYLDAMGQLNSINDTYICDSAFGIVSYFLCNSNQWQGPVARQYKAILRQMLKDAK